MGPDGENGGRTLNGADVGTVPSKGKQRFNRAYVDTRVTGASSKSGDEGN